MVRGLNEMIFLHRGNQPVIGYPVYCIIYYEIKLLFEKPPDIFYLFISMYND